MFNALSATFPEGERFFIESVVRFKDRLAEPLKGQVKTFVRQEALHTREHLAFNRQASDHYDLSSIEARTIHRINVSRGKHPVGQLGSTAALEHFTAIFAHVLLTQPRHLEGAPEEIARLWRWHSVEEIEHKAVAFDTYMAVMAKASPFKRWKVRTLTATISFYHFLRNLSRNVAELLRQDGIDWRTRRWSIYRQLFLSPGPVRRHPAPRARLLPARLPPLEAEGPGADRPDRRRAGAGVNRSTWHSYITCPALVPATHTALTKESACPLSAVFTGGRDKPDHGQRDRAVPPRR